MRMLPATHITLLQLEDQSCFVAGELCVLSGQIEANAGYGAAAGFYLKNQMLVIADRADLTERSGQHQEKYDYRVPEGLKSLYATRDYGRYADEDGKLPVCFLASNHTTGGNSGSPVLDAEGRLIGINFDRSWDGVMSDMQYEPEICRNIAVDIRFVLFMLDKYAGASHLIREMTMEE